MNSTCLLLKARYFSPWHTLFTFAARTGYGLSNSGANDSRISNSEWPSLKDLLVRVFTQKIFTIALIG
jgi:hypothetical protein